MERGVFLEMRNYITSLFLNFKKIPQPVGETALQPAAFVATKPWRTPRFGEVKRKTLRGEGRGLFPEKMEDQKWEKGITEP